MEKQEIISKIIYDYNIICWAVYQYIHKFILGMYISHVFCVFISYSIGGFHFLGYIFLYAHLIRQPVIGVIQSHKSNFMNGKEKT